MDKIIFIIKEIWLKRTIYRALFDWEVKSQCQDISGEVVDLASGGEASYHRFLPPGIKLTRTNYQPGYGVDLVIDLNNKLPISDDSIDNVLFLNALYIMNEPRATLAEIFRILKPGGLCFIVSPFIANEMPEPHDFCRLTAEGLRRELTLAGFYSINIKRIGERFSSAAYLLEPLCRWRVVKFLVYLPALFLDRMIPERVKKIHPAPLGYFCLVKKNGYE